MIPAIKTATSMRKILGDPDEAFAVTNYLRKCPTFPTVEELSKISGIGTRKAEILTGVFELQQQYFLGTELRQVLRPEDIFHQELAWMKYAPQENFISISLDSVNHVIGSPGEQSLGLFPLDPKFHFPSFGEGNEIFPFFHFFNGGPTWINNKENN